MIQTGQYMKLESITHLNKNEVTIWLIMQESTVPSGKNADLL